MKRLMVCGLAMGLAGTLACVDEGVDEDRRELGKSGLNLTIDLQGDTDVAGFRYSLSECGAASPIQVEDVELEDLTLPGMIPAFDNEPFDERSRHLFADYYTAIKPGCYDVLVEPLTRQGHLSADCSFAKAQDVVVEESRTTEILLISQCQPKDSGAIDVVMAMNHPPKIKTVEYSPSKDLKCPDAKVTLCATAKDANQDPMLFTWKKIKGPALKAGPDVEYSSQQRGEKKECISLKFENRSASYEFKVKVYDKFHDEESGLLISAEEWFKMNGYGQISSHAKAVIPVSVTCKDKTTRTKKKKRDSKKK